MAQENVVVVRFTEPSKAYQALSVLKDCDADGRIGLESAAIVERTATGELRIPDSADNVALIGTASGSLIGMLIGVLGGPVGVLLGWGAGAVMGGAFDIDRAVTSDEALTVLGRAIPTGSTAVIANVEEPAVEVIDGEMKKLDGEVTRRPVAEVMGELEAAEDAADAAAREARQADPRPAQGRAERRRRRARRQAEGEAARRLTTRAVPVIEARRPQGRRASTFWRYATACRGRDPDAERAGPDRRTGAAGRARPPRRPLRRGGWRARSPRPASRSTSAPGSGRRGGRPGR